MDITEFKEAIDKNKHLKDAILGFKAELKQ